MAKTIIIFLALSVFVAHCHVLKDKDLAESKKARQKRSCFVCDNDEYGPPPRSPPHGHPLPPPPFFRNWNWSAYGRGTDGSQPGSSSAASSFTGTSTGGQASGNYGKSAGNGDQSGANSQAQSDASQNGVEFVDQKKIAESGNYQQTPNFFGGYKNNFEGQGGSANNQGFKGQQQTQFKDFGVEAGGQNGFGGRQSGSASSAQANGFGPGPSGNEQQPVQSAGGGSGDWHGHGHGVARYQKFDSRGDNEQQVQSAGGGQWQGRYGTGTNSASSNQNGGGSNAGAGSSQEALSGALNLVSQGLQTAQKTECSTCDKSNYALSNAKSDSGNAIAVSIGR